MADTQVQRKVDVTMKGNGYTNFQIPEGGFQYIAVLNSATNNHVQLYQDTRTASEAKPLEALLPDVKPYQNITIPFNINEGRFFTVIWADGGGTMEKRLTLLFCVENPNINFQGSDGTGQSNVTLVNDQVGLAKQSQFPTALENGGRLKVNVQEPLTTSLTGEIPPGDNVIGKVDINNSIPAGSALIGKVDINTMPEVVVNITPEPEKTFTHASNNTMLVSDSHVQLPNVACKSVLLKSANANSGTSEIFICFTDTEAGFPLSSGESLVLDNIQNLNEIYVYRQGPDARLYYITETEV